MVKKHIPKSAISIPESELQFVSCRASGPGGQYVNTTDSAVQLRFDLANNTTIPEDIKERMRQLAGSRLSADGIIVIDASQNRSQAMNKIDAVAKLQELLDIASIKPKMRKKTKPSPAMRELRLRLKRFRSERKQRRRRPTDD